MEKKNKIVETLKTVSTWLVGLVGVNVGIETIANYNVLTTVIDFTGTVIAPILTPVVGVGAGIGGVFLIMELFNN